MSTPPEPARPSLVTMPLLDRLVASSLDQDYRHVADTRAAARASASLSGPQSGPPSEPPSDVRRPRRRWRGTAAAVAAFGLLVTVAAVQTWRDAPSTADDRAALIDQIGRENTAAAAQQRTLRGLKQQTTSLQRGLRTLSRTTAEAETGARRLAVRTGYGATSGAGVEVVTDDAAGGGDDGTIRDEDLALLVDGLWSAGARAVSINGIRLTALSPIRTSGRAIHVAFRPISPPYTVLALGDKRTLQARFADTTHGLAWLSLVQAFGFAFAMHNEDSLSLPAAGWPALRSVQAASSSDRPRSAQEDSRP